MDKVDASLSLAAFLGVVVFGVLQGIVVTIGLSLLAFVISRGGRTGPSSAGCRACAATTTCRATREGRRIPGIVIVRFDAPLFFANGATLRRLGALARGAAGPGVHTVILAAEPITDIDTTAIDELSSWTTTSPRTASGSYSPR